MNACEPAIQDLETIFKDGRSINELLSNPLDIAKKYNIQDTDAFVEGVKNASTIIPQEVYALFDRNPFVDNETKEVFRRLDNTNLDDSKVVGVTVTTLALALVALVAAAKAVKR